MTRGGLRQGAGRPKGVPNKDRRDFLNLIHKVGKPAELIGKLRELANGVKCAKFDKGVGVVYDKPPDVYAITYLLDQAFGKARQHIDTEISSEQTWEQLFLKE